MNEQVYEPAKVTLRAGVSVRLTFAGTTDKDLWHRGRSPVIEYQEAVAAQRTVVIEFTPAEADDVAFDCGMNMLHGSAIVQ